MRILIAEDELSSLDMCATALESKGHKVIGTTNGDDCLKVYSNSIKECAAKHEELSFHYPFDAVVLDYKMPGRDGKEVAKEIIRLNPQQRIIFASAFVKETLMDSVRELNQVTELIQKPFEPDVLVDLVENVQSARLVRNLRALAGQINDKHNTESADKQIRVLLETLHKIQGIE
jgi:DNA-binding response OmpR family regulator